MVEVAQLDEKHVRQHLYLVLRPISGETSAFLARVEGRHHLRTFIVSIGIIIVTEPAAAMHLFHS